MKQLPVEQPSQFQTIALKALARLTEGDTCPETVHTLRTTLRKLQAFLELEGYDVNAASVSRCVSYFSPIRTLQVFTGYLRKIGAPKSDIEILQKAIEEAWSELSLPQLRHKIERQLWRVPCISPRCDASLLKKRVEVLYQQHVNDLEQLLADMDEKPRRKRIHAIRLKIKTIRYQEECLLGRQGTRSQVLKRLKDVQSQLGKFEELAEFRKLAKTLKLESRPTIVKDWRRTRKRARGLVSELGWILEYLNSRRLHPSPRRSITPLAV